MESISSFSDRITRIVPSCITSFIDDAVVDTIIDFCKKTEFFRITVDNPEYTEGVNDYQNDEVRIGISIDGSKRPYSLLALAVGSEKYSKAEGSLVYLRTHGDIANRDQLWDSDKKYYNFPDQSHVAIFPVETSEMAETPTYFNLDIVMIPVDGITEIDEEIYENHRDVIEAGAIARLLMQPSKPWSDLQAAAMYSRAFAYECSCVIANNFNRAVLQNIKRTSYL
jgi:hypothetical protein